MSMPKLTADLPHPRRPDTCQACGIRSTIDTGDGHRLEAWRECDEADNPTGPILLLCQPCAKRLIEKHPRLYHQIPQNKPIPGAMPHLCLSCNFRKELECTHPALKANGGAGLEITVAPPATAFMDGRDKSGRRIGWRQEIWPAPASACAGWEGAA